MKRTFVIRDQSYAETLARFLAANWRSMAETDGPMQVTCSVYRASRTNDQNAKLHAVISDISEQVLWNGKKLNKIVWKRLCMAAWLRECGESPQLIPALDGNGFDVVFERTSKLNITQCSELIEWCFAFGVEHDVKFRL